MPFELDAPDPQIPETDAPLVVAVASTTGLESPQGFAGVVLEALADEPVRVVATLSRRGERWNGPTPENATVVDWLALPRVVRGASAVVCHGGHGTVAASLGAGAPVLVWPAGGNTAQIGSRVAWAGAGLMLPARFAGADPLRWAVRRLLGDSRFAERAGRIATWSAANDGPARAAELVAGYARR
jgi:UDP:flavonoid glycosyltransferase YjiC (YdhE family)